MGMGPRTMPSKGSKASKHRRGRQVAPKRPKPAKNRGELSGRSPTDLRGCRKASRQKVIDHFAGDLIGDRVAHDVREEVGKSVLSQSLVCLDLEDLDTVPGLAGRQDVGPKAAPTEPDGEWVE
jgi:hypothetical protein